MPSHPDGVGGEIQEHHEEHKEEEETDDTDNSFGGEEHWVLGVEEVVQEGQLDLNDMEGALCASSELIPRVVITLMLTTAWTCIVVGEEPM